MCLVLHKLQKKGGINNTFDLILSGLTNTLRKPKKGTDARISRTVFKNFEFRLPLNILLLLLLPHVVALDPVLKTHHQMAGFFTIFQEAKIKQKVFNQNFINPFTIQCFLILTAEKIARYKHLNSEQCLFAKVLTNRMKLHWNFVPYNIKIILQIVISVV